MAAAQFAAPAPRVSTPDLNGSYSMAAASGTMAAGLTAGAPIFSFRYGGSGMAVIRKVILSAGNAGTGFAAGVSTFDLYAARAFTVSDTGGTAVAITTNNGKLRTAFATTGASSVRIAATGTLTAGTRTLDTTQLVSFTVGTVVTAGITLLAPTDLLPKAAGEMQPIFATNEGFVIHATVPATGTWVFSVTVVWDEVSSF